MRISLTLALVLLATTAIAKEDFKVGDVLYCEMLENVEWSFNDKKLTHFELTKFKFKILDNKIKFGKSSYFYNRGMDIVLMRHGLLNTYDRVGIVSLDQSNFNYVASYYDSARMIAASCDKF